MLTVVLVSMPFMDDGRPSIQLGLLKAVAAAHGFAVRTLHANLDFANLIGVDDYRRLAQHRGIQTGDWLFSVEAFGQAAPDPDGRFVADFAPHLSDIPPERLLAIRQQLVPKYLDTLTAAIDWAAVDVVGFSSTFQQNTASFALARRLKARHLRLVTVFGGANFDGDMGVELVRALDFIDHAIIGEGDLAFPALLTALADGTAPAAIPGLARRFGATVAVTPPGAPLDRLDALPAPDYDEYFTRAENLGLLPATRQHRTWIPVETARGCWWGAKHHCVFCGLNATLMRFRSKSPQRVLDELAYQARRYGSFRFAAVDNILDPTYLTGLFPALVADGVGYQLFYEVKSNLSRDQVRLLADGGVTHIQPGIESLSTPLLRLMRKGVTAAQNINLLRWARYHHLDVAWNILWGIPGEAAQHHADQAAAMAHLTHLQPPADAGPIWLERFSPLFTDPSIARTPERSYRYVYPSDVDLEQIAYFFDHTVTDPLPDTAYNSVRAAVTAWKQAWKKDPRPSLTYRHAPGYLHVYDTRRAGHEQIHIVEGLAADVYAACTQRPITARAIQDRLRQSCSVDDVQRMITELHRRGLTFLDGAQALALALPA